MVYRRLYIGTLVAKAADPVANDAAVDGLESELLCSAKLLDAACLLLFSTSCRMCCPLRMYTRQHVRGAWASIASLVQHFVGRREIGGIDFDDGSKVAWRASAVWDACNKTKRLLPRGNRSTMKRELLVWVRNCNESIEDFEGILLLSPRSNCGGKGDDGDEEEAEEPYVEMEMAVARASVNVMKCSKNVLNLILAP